MQIFENKIREILIKQNVVIGLKFLLLAMLLVLLTFNIFFAAYSPTINSQGVLFLFAISLKIFLALVFIFLVLQANRALLSHLEAARYLDKFNNDKADTYQNAFELKQKLGKGEILERILCKADEKAKNQIIKTNTNKLMPILIITIIVIFFSGLLFIFNQSHFTQTYNFFKLKELPKAQQQRILSRLLDTQRSIHKREFSKKRKAETSEINNWDLPEEIKLKFDKMREKALL
jgi:uncharacterized membrane protein